MKTVEADFNRLARGGKVKIWLADVQDVRVGEKVLLVENAEDMELEGYLAEFDEKWAYFELASRAAHMAYNPQGVWLYNWGSWDVTRRTRPAITPAIPAGRHSATEGAISHRQDA